MSRCDVRVIGGGRHRLYAVELHKGIEAVQLRSVIELMKRLKLVHLGPRLKKRASFPSNVSVGSPLLERTGPALL